MQDLKTADTAVDVRLAILPLNCLAILSFTATDSLLRKDFCPV